MRGFCHTLEFVTQLVCCDANITAAKNRFIIRVLRPLQRAIVVDFPAFSS